MNKELVYMSIGRLLAVTTKHACLNPASVPAGGGGVTVRACGITRIGVVCGVCDLTVGITTVCADLRGILARPQGLLSGADTAKVVRETLFRLLDFTKDKVCLNPQTRPDYSEEGYTFVSCRCAGIGLCAVCDLCNVVTHEYTVLKNLLFGVGGHEKLEGQLLVTSSVWVVGRDNEKPEDHDGQSWDFIGVCSTEELAVEACEDRNYFTGPVAMDQMFPKELVLWPGVYRPKARKG